MKTDCETDGSFYSTRGDITPAPSQVSGFTSSYIEFDDWDEWSGEVEADTVNINTSANVFPHHS